MKLGSRHNVDAYFIHRAITNRADQLERAALALTDSGAYYECLLYPVRDVTTKFTPCAGVCNFSSFCATYPTATQIQDFIDGLHIILTSGAHHMAGVVHPVSCEGA